MKKKADPASKKPRPSAAKAAERKPRNRAAETGRSAVADNENLQGGRAAYGIQIFVTVSRELTAGNGRGFSYAEIARMIQFSQLFRGAAGWAAEDGCQ